MVISDLLIPISDGWDYTPEEVGAHYRHPLWKGAHARDNKDVRPF